jgi:2,3-bisphosphoglycerate-independent phosphoglycerate mutase
MKSYIQLESGYPLMRRVLLIVRDGWGYSTEKVGNAVSIANTPIDDNLMKTRPWVLLKCTGNAVGVPEGTQGGSEPGHLIMGAGRIVWQPLEEINRSIDDESFFSNPALLGAINYCKEKNGKLHLMGLLSNQGIHGTTSHLYALLRLSLQKKVDAVNIHCFLDGRDVPEKSAKKFIEETQKQTKQIGIGYISTLMGRYYAMDRDNNWDRIEKAYDVLTLGIGHESDDPIKALKEAYQRGDETDYYVEPIIINQKSKESLTIDDGDSVIFWNFRSDRARQITYALTKQKFDSFVRKKTPDIHFVCMSEYDKRLDLPVAFPHKKVPNNLGKVLSDSGLKQLRIAETEKYAHVTFFFNSQIEKPNTGEDRIMIPSPKVPNYEQQPEMSANEITEKLIREIRKSKYDFILVNYANGDLVGHSANIEAGVKAVETVDSCLGTLVEEGLAMKYTILVTGDHGNIETMLYPSGEVNPSHGLNPVPFILITNDSELSGVKLRKGMSLTSIAPTILDLLDIEKPLTMTGESLIHKKI